MELNDLISIISQNGVAVAVIVYFMFRDYKFIQKLTENIQQLIDCVKSFENTVRKEEK